MTNITWSDELGSRSRRAWLLLLPSDGSIHLFVGDSIPGVAAVVGSDYTQNGKWSHNTYRLLLAPGVRAISGHNGWETGSFREGLATALQSGPLDRWHDIANALGTTLSTTMEFLRAFRPAEADRLDQIEAAIEAVDTGTDTGADVVSISFGAPTRRLMEAGFWDWPVLVIDETGTEVGRITRSDDTGWTCSGPIRILSEEHHSGMHGGYVSFRLAVPEGCRTIHCKPPGG